MADYNASKDTNNNNNNNSYWSSSGNIDSSNIPIVVLGDPLVFASAASRRTAAAAATATGYHNNDDDQIAVVSARPVGTTLGNNSADALLDGDVGVVEALPVGTGGTRSSNRRHTAATSSVQHRQTSHCRCHCCSGRCELYSAAGATAADWMKSGSKSI
jgi:hypothetical protein